MKLTTKLAPKHKKMNKIKKWDSAMRNDNDDDDDDDEDDSDVDDDDKNKK